MCCSAIVAGDPFYGEPFGKILSGKSPCYKVPFLQTIITVQGLNTRPERKQAKFSCRSNQSNKINNLHPWKRLATPLLYSKPKDMLSGFKIGNGISRRKASRAAAILLTLTGGFAPAKLHADDHHTATARLQIEFTVVPSVIAAQPSQKLIAQPSQSLISFNLTSDNQQAGNVSTQKIVVTGQHGVQETAVLKTMTLVTE